MASNDCTLCGLDTPDPPVTGEQTEGTFCCTGCLQVYTLLRDMDDEKQAEELRKRTIEKRKQESEGVKLPDTCEEAFFKIAGMHCATCEAFIELLAERVEGVYKSEASYASELVKIYFDPKKISREKLPGLLSKMGYRVYPIEEDSHEENLNEVARLVIGGFFGIIGLLLYSLFLYPSYIGGTGLVPLTAAEQYFFISNIFVMTSFILFYTGMPILRGAWVSISVFKPNMDLLITIAALSAYLYSLGIFLSGSGEVYFDVTMAIILVVSIGNFYEKKIKSGKQDILKRLTENNIREARIQRKGQLESVAISDIRPGDRIVVKAGERIPIDGQIVQGKGVVNEALMTGESMPVLKKEGDRVLSGTILNQNAITITAGESVQSTMDDLLRLMWDIQSSRSGKQRLADRIASYFVPGVLLLGVGTFILYIVNGLTPTAALLSALAVLIVSCPCALGLATPLAIASGTREALRQNIIFKTAAIFEETSNTDILAFDKTGTLTTGHMQLLDEGEDKNALRYAALLEQYASHPVAKPIAKLAGETGTAVDHFQSFSNGVTGTIDGLTVFVGQPEWLIEMRLKCTAEQTAKVKNLREQGAIPVAVGWEGEIQSIIAVGDRLRKEAADIIKSLQKEGRKVAVITGDHKKASQSIQYHLQPDFLFTDARPESKSNIIKELRKLGRIAMVGDGSNDAPALAEADLGIAFGDLTALAADSAQIVIPNDRLHLIPKTMNAITQTRLRIRQNLGWAFLYNIITIPLAVAGLINPLFAAGAMAASSLLVVANSSREMKL
ncbi:MAG TPA: cation-translocating P-type ATPase [Halalkalibaculum sp.]|nr:cation-translocating P-type ATPase [Halalkalibaculum sp.]